MYIAHCPYDLARFSYRCSPNAVFLKVSITIPWRTISSNAYMCEKKARASTGTHFAVKHLYVFTLQMHDV